MFSSEKSKRIVVQERLENLSFICLQSIMFLEAIVAGVAKN